MIRLLVRLFRGTKYRIIFHPSSTLSRVETTTLYARTKLDALQRARVEQFQTHGDIRVVYIDEVEM